MSAPRIALLAIFDKIVALATEEGSDATILFNQLHAEIESGGNRIVMWPGGFADDTSSQVITKGLGNPNPRPEVPHWEAATFQVWGTIPDPQSATAPEDAYVYARILLGALRRWIRGAAMGKHRVVRQEPKTDTNDARAGFVYELQVLFSIPDVSPAAITAIDDGVIASVSHQLSSPDGSGATTDD